MTARADAPVQGSRLAAFLWEELAPRPGRWATVARITVGATLVVVIGMLYQIPLLAYAAYIVFLASKDEAASTIQTSVAACIAVTVALTFSLLLYTFDAGEPALRIPLMAACTFLGMFLSRTIALGPVAFLTGFVLVVSQTVIDDVPTLEDMTRVVLWLWVIIILPAFVSTMINLLSGAKPETLALRSTLSLIDALAAALRTGEGAPLARQAPEVVRIFELLQKAGKLSPDLRNQITAEAALVETLSELVLLPRLLPGSILPPDVRRPLVEACEDCRRALADGTAPTPQGRPRIPEQALRDLDDKSRPVVVALAQLLERLSGGIARRLDPPGAPPAGAPAGAKSLFVPDAFSNPDHTRFALKTTIAVMAAYIIYNGIDWPGIRTAVITCFFVAQGTAGETMHKLSLRIGGAVVGGLIGGLCIVFVLPELTDIGQLAILIAIVSAVCAWVSTSSELLAYAGMQMAFAFFLGVLQTYGPATDLKVLRDRVVGILLGNILMTIIFSMLWPVSAGRQARSALASALRTLGQLLSADPAQPRGQARLAVAGALARARRYAATAALEPEILSPKRVPALPVERFERLTAAVYTVVGQPGAEPARAAADSTIAAWLAACAARIEDVAPPPPPPPPVVATLADQAGALPADAPATARAAYEARQLLLSEIAVVRN